jgi:hypothetical protein
MHSKHFLSALIVVLVAVSAGWARTDKAEVVAVGDGYDIHIRSEGYSWIPITPDGPFPKWGHSNRFRAQGDGKRVAIDGVIYKEYALGTDLKPTGNANKFSTCILRISEETKRIILQAQLSPEDYIHFDPSGTYDGVKIDHPKVVDLSPRTKIEDINGRYIQARGHYEYPHPQHPAEGRFIAEGKTFRIFNLYLGKDGDFEIVGHVFNAIPCGLGEGYILGVSFYKRIPAK